MKTGEASADRSKLWDLNFTPPLSFKNPEEANIKSAKAEDSSSISDETFVNPAVKMTFKSERKLCRSARDLSKGIYKDDSGTSNSSVFNAVDINITNDDNTKYLECEASSSSTKPIVSKSSSILSNLLGFSMDKPRLKTCITRQYFPPKIPLDSVIPSVSASSEREFSEANWADARLKLPPPPPRQKQVKKSRRGPRSRSSQYRGVTFYKRTGRWESHIWAYDRAAIKFRGPDADINFNLSDYDEDLKEMSSLTKADMVHILRRQANGFSRGSYRYNCAAINCNGKEAVTNFDASIHSEPKNRSVEQNLDLSLSLSLPIGSGTLILEDNKKMPVPKMKSNINTFAQIGRKKARHINKMVFFLKPPVPCNFIYNAKSFAMLVIKRTQ